MLFLFPLFWLWRCKTNYPMRIKSPLVRSCGEHQNNNPSLFYVPLGRSLWLYEIENHFRFNFWFCWSSHVRHGKNKNEIHFWFPFSIRQDCHAFSIIFSKGSKREPLLGLIQKKYLTYCTNGAVLCGLPMHLTASSNVSVNNQSDWDMADIFVQASPHPIFSIEYGTTSVITCP